MSDLLFEPYSIPSAAMQGEAIHAFVEGDPWIQQHRPDIAHRHRTPEDSRLTIERVMALGQVAPWIVRRSGDMVISIGTFANRFAVKSPLDSREIYAGRHIDYCAAENVTDDEHREIATGFATQNGYEGQVLATLLEEERNPSTGRSRGAAYILHAIGTPSGLRVPSGYEDLGLNRVKAPTQLYVGNTNSSLAPEAIDLRKSK